MVVRCSLFGVRCSLHVQCLYWLVGRRCLLCVVRHLIVLTCCSLFVVV